MGRINRPKLTLYGRPWCHLCESMLVALEALRSEHDFEVEVLDIDACSATTLVRYDGLIPVLAIGGEEICHYYLDAAKVREVFSRFR